MSRIANLDTRNAHYDRFRNAVIVRAGRIEVAIVLDALESRVNRTLTYEEAVAVLDEQKAVFSKMANATAPSDNVITITSGLVNSRPWDLEPAADEGLDWA